MPTYNYRAKNRDGELIKGSVESETEKEAASIIDSQKLVLIDLVDKSQEIDITHLETTHHVSLKELMIFSKQFAGMVGAGLSLVESLATLAEDEKNKYFANVINEISEKVEGGGSLSGSISTHPDIFPAIYVNLIKVGEASGELSGMLLKLADQLEKEYQLRAQIKGAMIYPIFILFTLVAVAVLAVTFVLPKMMPILESSGVDLPLLTRMLVSTSNALRDFWYIIVPVILGGSAYFYYSIKRGPGYILWSKAKLHLPIAGKIIRNVYSVRFLSSVSIMLSAGLGVIETLRITSKVIGNPHYEKELIDAIAFIENGGSLHDAFKDSDYITTITKKMIKVGEATGTLDVAMGNLAKFYDDEVNNQISNLSKTIEPVLIVVMGIMVGLFVSAVIMPLYDATTSVGNM